MGRGIPVSPVCNAQCLGCISLQPSECCPSPQTRIAEHLSSRNSGTWATSPKPWSEAIISFGQGCEGEPSLQGQIIGKLSGNT